MRVDDIFPPEVIDEDIKKFMGGALAAGVLAATPAMFGHPSQKDTMENSIAQDVSVMAQTMWGEARGHGPEGMAAIGFVIKNRADADKGLTFGHGIRGVAKQRKQFSCWNEGDPNKSRMLDMQSIDRAIQYHKSPDSVKSYEEWFTEFKNSKEFKEYQPWRQAFILARKILSGQLQDPTHGAFFYHTSTVHPKWAQGAIPVGKIANHIFYRRVN